MAKLRHGSNFRDGVGRKKDLIAAEKWLCRSALTGYSHNMRQLAELYMTLYSEKGLEIYLEAARAWYKASADNEFNDREWIVLGQLFENGRVLKRNYKEAAQLYKKTIENSENTDLVNIGKYRFAMLIWFDLLEESREKKSAIQMFSEAALSGHEGAKNMIEYIN